MMRLLIEKGIHFLKKINKEYVFLFCLVIVIGFLIYSANTIPQGLPQELVLTTTYPAPFGEYNELTARRIIDYDNAATFVVDPSGVSTMHQIRLLQNAAGANNGDLTLDGSLRGTTSSYYINLNSGYAFLQSINTSGRITMGAASADDVLGRTKGKTVYDLAEGMLVAADCEAGDVVSISRQEEELLVKTRKKFDADVAGIISGDPKLYLGAIPGNSPIALAGIVECKVNTENGPVKRGDMLVSSSEPGYAMRAGPEEIKAGMLIGKALQELQSGKGKIHVLVNKQ